MEFTKLHFKRLVPFLLLSLLILTAGCQKNTGLKQAASPSVAQTITLHDIEVLALDDSALTFQAEVFSDLDAYPDRKAMMPEGKFPALTRTYLVRTAGRTVLIDAGMGKELGVHGRTPELLAANGIRPEDVTDIILTHSDIDHVAGLIQGGRAVYPRATLRLSRPEYEALVSGAVGRPAEQLAVSRAAIRSYEGRIELFAFGDTVLPGIVAMNAVGHTPGHTVLDITSGGKGLSIVGDLLHVYPIQLRFTDYCTIYDGAPSNAAASREETLKRLTKSDRIVAGMHFPMIGKVRPMQEGGYAVLPE